MPTLPNECLHVRTSPEAQLDLAATPVRRPDFFDIVFHNDGVMHPLDQVGAARFTPEPSQHGCGSLLEWKRRCSCSLLSRAMRAWPSLFNATHVVPEFSNCIPMVLRPRTYLCHIATIIITIIINHPPPAPVRGPNLVCTTTRKRRHMNQRSPPNRVLQLPATGL